MNESRCPSDFTIHELMDPEIYVTIHELIDEWVTFDVTIHELMDPDVS